MERWYLILLRSKFLLLVLVPAMVFSLAACAGLEPAPESARAKALEAGQQLPPAEAYYHFFLAELFQASQQFDAAVEQLKFAIQADPVSSYMEIELARLYLQQNKVADALIHARMAAGKNPDDHQARMLAASILTIMKRNDEAIAEYETLLQRDPENEEALLVLGSMYAELGRMDQAEEALIRLLKVNPSSHLAYYYLGRVEMQKNDTAKAEQYLRKAFELNGDFITALSDLASIYESQEKYDLAEEAYKEIIKVRGGGNLARARLGRLYLKTERRQEARQLFEQIIRSSADPNKARVEVGLIYFEQGVYDDAAWEFKHALAEDPENDRVHYYLGSTYEEMENYEKAAAEFLNVQAGSQFFGDSRLHLSYVLSELDRLDEAIDLMKKAVKEEAANTSLYLALGTLYETKKDYARAIATIDEGLNLEPDDVELNFRRGVVLDKSGDKDATIDAMRKVIALRPDHADALNYLAYTWADLGINLDEALEMAIKADRFKPDNGFITDTVAWILFKKGEYGPAVELLEKAVALQHDDPIINEHLGDAYVKVRKYRQALEAYLKAKELGPENTERLNGKIEEVRKSMD